MATTEAGSDQGAALAAAIAGAESPVAVTGSGTKAFLGRPLDLRAVSTLGHRGIVEYDPSELVVTVRAGTPLSELEAALFAEGQMLPFEPPAFGEGATVGGTIAAGLSGPRRPYAGAARDFVLGMRVVNGAGEVLRFGGQVMKNVAGYDVSRLLVGSMGTLALILEVSMKVLPCPERELTLRRSATPAEAMALFHETSASGLPVTATCAFDGAFYVRLSGPPAAVAEAGRRLGGDPVASGAAFWSEVANHRLPFFQQEGDLWRFSVVPDLAPERFGSESVLVEWGGAQRWVVGRSGRDLRSVVGRGTDEGHATIFRAAGPGDNGEPRYEPLDPVVFELHRGLKQAFDPKGVLNPGRMYAGI